MTNGENNQPKSCHEFSILASSLENERRLIAAGKLQRWDTVKWVITINVALTAASIAISTKGNGFHWTHFMFFALAVFVAIVGHFLIRHYDRRIAGAREVAWFLENHIEKICGFDVKGIAYQSKEKPSTQHDWQELFWFGLVIVLSVLPTLFLVVWKFFCLPT